MVKLKMKKHVEQEYSNPLIIFPEGRPRRSARRCCAVQEGARQCKKVLGSTRSCLVRSGQRQDVLDWGCLLRSGQRHDMPDQGRCSRGTTGGQRLRTVQLA